MSVSTVCKLLNGDSRRLKNAAILAGQLGSRSGCSYCVGSKVMVAALREGLSSRNRRYDVGNC